MCLTCFVFNICVYWVGVWRKLTCFLLHISMHLVGEGVCVCVCVRGGVTLNCFLLHIDVHEVHWPAFFSIAVWGNYELLILVCIEWVVGTLFFLFHASVHCRWAWVPVPWSAFCSLTLFMEVCTSLTFRSTTVFSVFGCENLWSAFTVCKQSCGKVMFSQACVKNSVHGGVCQTFPLGRHPLGRHSPGRHPLGRHSPWADTPLRQTPPFGRHPPADGYCSGQYASYWNAFLLIHINVHFVSCYYLLWPVWILLTYFLL